MSLKSLRKLFGVDLPQHVRAQINENDQDVLQVIGAGLPRTGTTSLKAALEILGFNPCHHMAECFDHPDQSIAFAQLIKPKTEASSHGEIPNAAKLKALMRGFRATVDSPGCDLYEDLMLCYPNAKVLLSVRDSDEQWANSFNATIGKMFTWQYPILIFPIGFLRKQRYLTGVVVTRWKKLANVSEIGPAVHKSHNAQVRATVPKQKLLEYNVKMGWPKLCEFLEVPVPDQPFPNLNDAAMILRLFNGAQLFGACVWLLYLGIAAGSVILLFWPRYVLQYF